MIDDSKKKTFNYVLVYQLDRFARNRYDSTNYKAKLKKSGACVLSVKENIIEDASEILIDGVLESMEEYYSAELSQKVKRGMRESYEKVASSADAGFSAMKSWTKMDDKQLWSKYCQRCFYEIQKRRKGERNYCKAERTRY